MGKFAKDKVKTKKAEMEVINLEEVLKGIEVPEEDEDVEEIVLDSDSDSEVEIEVPFEEEKEEDIVDLDFKASPDPIPELSFEEEKPEKREETIDPVMFMNLSNKVGAMEKTINGLAQELIVVKGDLVNFVKDVNQSREVIKEIKNLQTEIDLLKKKVEIKGATATVPANVLKSIQQGLKTITVKASFSEVADRWMPALSKKYGLTTETLKLIIQGEGRLDGDYIIASK